MNGKIDLQNYVFETTCNGLEEYLRDPLKISFLHM